MQTSVSCFFGRPCLPYIHDTYIHTFIHSFILYFYYMCFDLLNYSDVVDVPGEGGRCADGPTWAVFHDSVCARARVRPWMHIANLCFFFEW